MLNVEGVGDGPEVQGWLCAALPSVIGRVPTPRTDLLLIFQGRAEQGWAQNRVARRLLWAQHRRHSGP